MCPPISQLTQVPQNEFHFRVSPDFTRESILFLGKFVSLQTKNYCEPSVHAQNV